jgi:rieske iron-sulfur protein
MAEVSRRVVICGLLPATVCVTNEGHADDETDPARSLPPRPGDFLVLADPGHESTPLRPADLKLGDDPTLAWSLDPTTKLPRDGTRLNQLLLMRFDPATLGSTEKPRAADGVVAYSAICTHQGCTVTDWLTAKQVLQCPCHQSEYDPRNGAKVMVGPAPRALPALPLKLIGGVLVVAAPFTDRVGGEKHIG